ncbi:MAG: ATP-binding cassette domain-containing protein, partial [Verrucomicrobiia bacterium]
EKRVMSAAAILGLTEPDNLLERKPKALSGGQRQRVALGRAIVRQPKAFLFDEPLSNLDAKMRVEMRTEISKLHNRLNSTMIYVTHDQVEAMTMADRIVVMKGGYIQQIAEPLRLYNEPANLFVAGFIGSPPMNFFRGTMMREGGGLWFVEDVKDPALPVVKVKPNDIQAQKLVGYEGKPVIFGSRPEDIREQLTASPAPPGHAFEAMLEVLEPMGAETFLYLVTSSTNLIVRAGPVDAKSLIGKRMQLVVEMNKAHFFDVATENVIV